MVSDLKARLLRGEILIGTILSMPSPEVAEVLASAGFDWLFVDVEHGAMGPTGVQRMLQAADHSTPCQMKSHSWHPNPLLIHSAAAMPDSVEIFTERACGQGYLGRFSAVSVMPLLLAHAGKLQKYGA